MTTRVICFVDGGNVIGARADNEDVEFVVWDNDNIEAGDEPPLAEDEIRQRYPVEVY